MIRGPASHPQLLGNSSEQGTLSWMRTRNYASTPAKSSSLNWSPAKADSQNTIFEWENPLFLWKITIFNGKNRYFNGKITIFNGKIHYFNGKITIFNGKIHYFNGNITIFNGKIHYFYGKTRSTSHADDFFWRRLVAANDNLTDTFRKRRSRCFPCQRMSFWPSARIWQVSEAMSANMRTIIEPMVTGSARSRLGSVEHFTISLESRYQNQHAHSTGF